MPTSSTSRLRKPSGRTPDGAVGLRPTPILVHVESAMAAKCGGEPHRPSRTRAAETACFGVDIARIANDAHDIFLEERDLPFQIDFNT